MNQRPENPYYRAGQKDPLPSRRAASPAPHLCKSSSFRLGHNSGGQEIASYQAKKENARVLYAGKSIRLLDLRA